MKRNWMKLSLTALFALVAAVGCDSIANNELTGPKGGVEPVLIEYVVNGVKIVVETDPTVGTVTGEFGTSGGFLALGKHILHIPAGAVSGPTKFVMKKPGDELKFSLSATSRYSLIANNVGAAGFAVPVKLGISYANTGVTSPENFGIAWLKLLGNEKQPTSIDYNSQRVVGELDHFSDYALIWP